MASGFEIKVAIPGHIINEIAENYVDCMELPEEYDTQQIQQRLSDDPDFHKLIQEAVLSQCQDFVVDHWSYDLSERVSEDIGQVGWLAEIEQDVLESAALDEFQESLINESRWVLEAQSAADMLRRLGWEVSRPEPKKRKRRGA